MNIHRGQYSLGSLRAHVNLIYCDTLNTLPLTVCLPFQTSSFLICAFKSMAKLANESTPSQFTISLSSRFCLCLSCSCCHGDRKRKQRRSDKTERVVEVAAIDDSMPNKPQFFSHLNSVFRGRIKAHNRFVKREVGFLLKPLVSW